MLRRVLMAAVILHVMPPAQTTGAGKVVAVRLAAWLVGLRSSALYALALNIDLAAYKFQMGWVHTVADEAQVIPFHAGWWLPTKEMMGQSSAAHMPISGSTDVTLPEPTVISLEDSVPEALFVRVISNLPCLALGRLPPALVMQVAEAVSIKRTATAFDGAGGNLGLHRVTSGVWAQAGLTALRPSIIGAF